VDAQQRRGQRCRGGLDLLSDLVSAVGGVGRAAGRAVVGAAERLGEQYAERVEFDAAGEDAAEVEVVAADAEGDLGI